MSENYKDELINTKFNVPFNSEYIQDTFINGTELQMFNVLFNSMKYNSDYIESPSHFLKLYKKYPGKKTDFLEYVLNNTDSYRWSNSDEDFPPLTTSENFEKMWGFPPTKNTPIIFSIMTEVDKDSQMKLMIDTDTYSSSFFRAIQNHNFSDKDSFFPSSITKSSKISYDGNIQEPEDINIPLSDHILFNFIRNKEYDLLNLYYSKIYENLYDKKLNSYVNYDVIEDLKIVNVKYTYNKIIDPQSTSPAMYCQNIQHLFLSLSLIKPEILSSYINQNYSSAQTSYTEWAKIFIATNPKPNKENLIIFNEFCEVFSKNLELKDDDIYEHILSELLLNENIAYANIFIKKIKNLSINKYISLNSDKEIFHNIIETTKNPDIIKHILKNNPNFLFSLTESLEPHSLNINISRIYSRYCEEVNLRNKQNEETFDQSSGFFVAEPKKLLNIQFIQEILNDNSYDCHKLYDLLLEKPFIKNVSNLGYTSNIHYLLNTNWVNSFTNLINDIIITKYPQIKQFKIENSTIKQKFEQLSLIEKILTDTLFLPTTEHSNAIYEKVSVLKQTKDSNKIETNSFEQIINIFHLKNGHCFTTEDKNLTFSIVAELFPKYIELLTSISNENIPNTSNILSKFSNNIINFFENSLNGLSVYQEYINHSYTYPENNNFIFLNDCFNFIITSGLYDKEQIIHCIEKLQQSSQFLYYQGEKNIGDEHFYYTNISCMDKVTEQLKGLFINMENTYLELNVSNNSHTSKNNLKF